MRSNSFLFSLAGLILLGIPWAVSVHLLGSETAFPQRSQISDSGAARESETLLRLGFAARSGVYLNVHVAIRDRNGTAVAELVSASPWLQVALTPGVYNVTASYDGKAHELRNLRVVDGDVITHVLYWDLNIMALERRV